MTSDHEAEGQPRVYLCGTAGLIEPRVLSGPWPDDTLAPPDAAIIAALQDDVVEEDDFLFKLHIDAQGKPSFETFSGEYMDDMRAKAEALPDEGLA